MKPEDFLPPAPRQASSMLFGALELQHHTDHKLGRDTRERLDLLLIGHELSDSREPSLARLRLKLRSMGTRETEKQHADLLEALIQQIVITTSLSPLSQRLKENNQRLQVITWNHYLTTALDMLDQRSSLVRKNIYLNEIGFLDTKKLQETINYFIQEIRILLEVHIILSEEENILI